jgi:prepilin-type N-terminal cleavage/methylation domain-containing protein
VRGDARGFTLVEILIATAIFMAGIAALAQVSARSAGAGAGSRSSTLAALAAAAKLEQLRSLAFGVDAAGAAVTDADTDTTLSPESTGGAGLSRSPPGTLSSNVAGYCDFLDENGRQVAPAAPATAPLGSRYARRWSISPLAEGEDDAVVVEVAVWSVSGGEEARMVALWTRRAR